MLTDGLEHLLQQLELVGYKGVNVFKLIRVLIAGPSGLCREEDHVGETVAVGIIQGTQRSLRVLLFIQNTALDDLISVRARKKETGVEPALNLGEVVLLVFGAVDHGL